MKPETSVMVGLATAALVWSIHANVTPPLTDVRVGPPLDDDVAGSRRAATWTSLAAVSGISLIAKDPTVFIIGGTMVILADVLTRHANLINPETGRMALPGRGNMPALQEVAPDPALMSGAGF